MVLLVTAYFLGLVPKSIDDMKVVKNAPNRSDDLKSFISTILYHF